MEAIAVFDARMMYGLNLNFRHQILDVLRCQYPQGDKWRRIDPPICAP